MHRKPPLEEFFYLLVTALKLVHPDSHIVMGINNQKIFQESKYTIQFYEYISFIQKYLDDYVLKLKHPPSAAPEK